VATVRMVLEYDGTNFVGWQVQPNGRSVQEEVERAARQILQRPVSVIGGGRTDAGVHALGQVGSFQVEGSVDVHALIRGMNSLLPEDVVVRSLVLAPDTFHARYSALERRYTYCIRRRPTAIQRQYCWQLFYTLDVERMQECAALLVGEQDFGSFCKADAEVKHTICTVTRANWTSADELLEFRISANRFLYGMVRALVGTMVDVGRGYSSVDDFRRILTACDRKAAGMSAPAKGLFLEEIVYR